ncbi:MAG: TIGR00282 family metallophosphoesterase [Candidatus Omnitrophota bacterium]
MKILFIGDIVGSPGRNAVKELVPKLKQERAIDLVIANAENSSGGTGLTPKTAEELFASGCDCLTTGDHIWKLKEVFKIIDHPYILRPLNLAPNIPGKGYCVIKKNNFKVGLINLQGRVFMSPIECPFRAVRELIPIIRKEANIILVDIHAEATSEKVAMGHFLDGLVSAVVGTHTHIQTADEKILPRGTAYISELGMCGPYDSVIGQEKSRIIERFLTGMPVRFEVATGDAQVHGVIIDIDEHTGKARSIERIQEKAS